MGWEKTPSGFCLFFLPVRYAAGEARSLSLSLSPGVLFVTEAEFIPHADTPALSAMVKGLSRPPPRRKKKYAPSAAAAANPVLIGI